MISFLYKRYYNCAKNDIGGWYGLINKLYKLFFIFFCNYCLVLYYRASKKRNTLLKKDVEPKVIVSLTSYPKRINTLWITIESLIRQHQKPDMIILWLAREQFPDEAIPQTLIEQQKRGLTIRWCDNLMSHKKYYYVFQEYPRANIITADDDMIYPPFFVSRLWRMHLDHPNDVVALTCQTISPSYRTPPSKWLGVSKGKIVSSYQISLNSGSGALFPPNSLPNNAFNKNAIQRLCPYADDLWLTAMTHMNGVRTTKFEYNPFPIVIRATLGDSLCSTYNSAIKGHLINNDTQWAAITQEYANQLKAQIGNFF